MPDQSANLGLPYLLPAQAQKHVTHNEALEKLDLLVQTVVQAFDAQTPPTVPAEGTAYALGANPTGDWAGKAGMIAIWQNSGWDFIAPRNGWRVATPDGVIRVYNNGWIDPRAVGQIANLPALGVGTTPDSTNKLSVSSPATLLNHAGNGHQVKINKAATTDTASLLFQSNWSGRAEMGLAGSDNFAVKVSDGSTWTTAISVAGASGAVTLANVLRLTPMAQPTGQAGMVYFDSTTLKLRCHNGTQWNDLF